MTWDEYLRELYKQSKMRNQMIKLIKKDNKNKESLTE